MDRFFLSLMCIAAVSGCSTSHSFLAKDSCGDCPATCGEAADGCTIQEGCQPLLLSECGECPPLMGCCDDGCSDGCPGCTGQGGGRKSRAYSGLEGGVERGKKNMLLDGAGWVMGIPNKLLLWNTKVDSHSVSPETERQVSRYLASRGLDDVKVRINQYDPLGEWRRLRNNKAIHPAARYTVGAFAAAKYTITPGRLFGNDEYNPFTNSISLYSDRASIALRESAHAKQTLESRYPSLRAASTYLPGSPLWIDTPAIREVIGYSRMTGQRKLERESYLVLFPAFGARMGSSATFFLDAAVGRATQGGFALLGHAVGRTKALGVSEGPIEMVKSIYGIVKQRPPIDDVWSSHQEQTVELQNPMPLEDVDITLVPLDVIYDSLQ